MLVGRPLKPRVIEADLRARFTLLGGARSLAAIALGAIDMAAWDALAHAAGKPVSSHISIEASSHLLAVTPTCNWLEYLDAAAGVVREPLAVRDGSITARDVPGTGLDWDASAVARCRAD